MKMTWRYVNRPSSTRVGCPFCSNILIIKSLEFTYTPHFSTPSIFLSDAIASSLSHSHFQPQVLVSKLWSLLLKGNVIPSPCEEDEEDESGWEGGKDSGCELCARVMPLTRHHLRPRATHKKLLKQVRREGRSDGSNVKMIPAGLRVTHRYGEYTLLAQGISQEELNTCAAICR